MNQYIFIFKIFFLFFSTIFVIYFLPLRTESNMLFLAETNIKEFINERLEGDTYWKVVKNINGPIIEKDEYCKRYIWYCVLTNGDTASVNTSVRYNMFSNNGCSDGIVGANRIMYQILEHKLDVNLIIDKR